MTIKVTNEQWLKNTIVVSDELKLYDYLIQIHCIVEKIVTSFVERALLTYYTKWGINPETERLFEKDYRRNKQGISNLKYHLKNKGLLHKNEDSNEWWLPEFLSQKYTSLTLILDINATK